MGSTLGQRRYRFVREPRGYVDAYRLPLYEGLNMGNTLCAEIFRMTLNVKDAEARDTFGVSCKLDRHSVEPKITPLTKLSPGNRT
jgi:hypothetical protein